MRSVIAENATLHSRCSSVKYYGGFRRKYRGAVSEIAIDVEDNRKI